MFYYLGRVLKLLLYGIDLLLFTLVLYLLSFAPKGWVQGFYPRLFWLWCWLFVHALGVDLRLYQNNSKPLPKHYILIANHPSAFEDIGIPALFPVYSLAKIEVRDWWIVGRISAAAGNLYVHREQRESRREAYQQIINELKSGKNIALYPEGGCKGRRIFESFRYGAFDISLNTGIPILPVFLHYEAQEDFEWRPGEYLLEKIWHILSSKNNHANCYVFDALDPAEFDSKEQYTEHVHGLYLKWQAKYLE
ncbi:MAG: 1-acyl-sn-glycerol-3-phosphate acyltransferase [Gammaproteobacteria bacterium]|nr:1-acyl-sn-glycerol-3-phosphate acyltransferase [Gammaproteobacteria bacterium]